MRTVIMVYIIIAILGFVAGVILLCRTMYKSISKRHTENTPGIVIFPVFLVLGLDFSCVKRAVEKSEFHCTLGEERMEIYSMISCSIVVLMIDSTAITIICSAIPDFFGFFFCKILILFHSIKERFVKFVAPVTLAVSDLESFVNQILSGCHKVN